MRKSLHAFTLTEILVSMLVLVITVSASLMAVNVISPTAEATRLRIKAENLLTKSQEEVHRVAQTQFDVLENCDFRSTNNCGFVDTTGQFPEFVRSLTVTKEGSSDLKRVRVRVTWNELGLRKSLDSVSFLSRPPDPLPGNLIGMVRDNSTNAILSGVNILVRNTITNETSTTVSSGAILPRSDGLNTNYNFSEPGTGRFLLKPGTWHLTATHPGYVSYVKPDDINIDSSQEQAWDFNLVPQPTPAHIRGQLLNGATRITRFNASSINLYRNGIQEQHTGNVRLGNAFDFNFEITFDNPNRKCFTLATLNAYKSGYAGQFLYNGFPYQADGWSSSAVTANGSNPPWVGGSTTDSLCVSPGDTLIQNISLVPVPTATVEGHVYDQNHRPMAYAANINVHWHDDTGWPSQNGGTTDQNGYYQVNVPAEQEMFPPDSAYWVKIFAQTNALYTHCCSEPAATLVRSDTVQVGPLFLGNTRPQDLTIDTSHVATDCSNAQGNVYDDANNGASLASANIRLSSYNQSRQSDGVGSYLFSCTNSSLGFRIPIGGADVQADKGGYYTFQSTGNSYYAPTGQVQIAHGPLNTLPDIRLWPQGQGTIHGKVTDSGSGQPISGIQVYVALGIGGSLAAQSVTDSQGNYTINDVVETWPPSNLPNDSPQNPNPRYNHTPMNHHMTVSATGSYQSYTSSPFTLDTGENKQENISLTSNGGA